MLAVCSSGAAEPSPRGPDSLGRVIRPTSGRRAGRLLLAVCAAALLTSGCATFTNKDTAAKLGDAELSMDDVADGIDELGAVVGERNGDAARYVVGTWLAERTAVESGLVDRYANRELAVTCVFAAFAGDLATAQSISDRVTAGEEWSAVVAELAPSPDDGRQQCIPLAQFPQEAVDVLAPLEPGGAPGVLEDPAGGAFAVRAQGADEVDPASLLSAVAAIDPEALETMQALAAEAWINPGIGTVNQSLQVVPLG